MAASAVTAALILGVVGTGIGLLEANRQRRAADASAAVAIAEADRATKAEALARTRLAESEATVQFLDEMLASADPSAQGRDVTVRKVLDGASKDVSGKFGERPLVAARLHGTIGRTYMSLGIYDESESHLRDQLEVRTRLLGRDDPETCRAVNELGAILIKAGKFPEAEAVFKEALAHHERLFGRHAEITLASLDGLAGLYTEQLRSQEAEPLLREVIAAREASGGADRIENASTLNALATLCADTERFEEARSLYSRALEIHARLHGADHPYGLELRGNVAWLDYSASVRMNEKDPEGARRMLERSRVANEEVLAAKRRVLGDEHQSTMTTLNNLAVVYKQLGELDLSEKLRREELELCVRILGEDHPDTAVSLSNLGAFLRDRGRFEEAVTVLERALRVSRKVLPAGHEGLGFTLGWYGGSLLRTGRFQEAQAAFLESREIFLKRFGPDHPITMASGREMKLLYQTWDKAEPGKGYAEKALAYEPSAGGGGK
ncbi:MAG TPA: tetratricopeptide repeat protein, partial [Phycisphaerales bacterium]|nr:tetratricopeptide repeat protein [Phycisphaerales bacterium]